MGYKPSLSASSLVRHLFVYVIEGNLDVSPSDSLTRGLLNSRTGIQESDCVVYYLVRRVVQIGLLAMIWAILGLVAFIFMPKFCSLFDMTVGSIYTHVSGSSRCESVTLDMGDVQVIFDTLQSRHRLPESILAESSQFDMALTAQVRYLALLDDRLHSR
jgi:hypothetical protein